jgi:hypothetical protein
VLENLEPANPIPAKQNWRPGVDFDGESGVATTPGYDHEPQNFDEFLLDAGLDPTNIEVIPPVRTSRWQQQKDGELVWLTSYRFNFRRSNVDLDLPLLWSQAKKQAKKPKPVTSDTDALVVLWSDLQVGKSDKLGGVTELTQRVTNMQAKLQDIVKAGKFSKVIFVDLGDTVEGFENKASTHQLQSNDLSIMDQVDLATTYAWDTLSMLAKHVPEIIYASVGSNHCQWRIRGQKVGKATDDWGVFIGRQLARLAQQTGHDHIRFIEPQPHDESLAVDVFNDEFHILGIVHGHQVNQPNQIREWWIKQAFGAQPVSAANILVHGHFHHVRIIETGGIHRGDKTTSRFIVGASTLDNGSNWYRMTSGEDAQPGLVCFPLAKGKEFTGTIWKLTE